MTLSLGGPVTGELARRRVQLVAQRGEPIVDVGQIVLLGGQPRLEFDRTAARLGRPLGQSPALVGLRGDPSSVELSLIGQVLELELERGGRGLRVRQLRPFGRDAPPRVRPLAFPQLRLGPRSGLIEQGHLAPQRVALEHDRLGAGARALPLLLELPDSQLELGDAGRAIRGLWLVFCGASHSARIASR